VTPKNPQRTNCSSASLTFPYLRPITVVNPEEEVGRMASRGVRCALIFLMTLTPSAFAQTPIPWKIHDPERPLPPVVDPGMISTPALVGKAPSDSAVLFDGKDLSQWVSADGKPAKWKVEDGYMQVVPGTGDLATKDSFGDCQLHVEFSEPTP